MFGGEKLSSTGIEVYELIESAYSSPIIGTSRQHMGLYSSLTRPLRWAAVLIVGLCMTVYLGLLPFPSSPHPNPARYTTAQELLSRPLARNLHSVPKLLHQSWSSTNLPARFEKWSATCREQHPDWEWVLWTDEDNLNLVKKHFPWFVDTYTNLPGIINRADVARNMYMYIYGGVYADFDLECLRPLDELFDSYNVSTASHLSTLASSSSAEAPSRFSLSRTAFLGRMGTDLSFEHSVPNAWMASTPAQPFWLVAIEEVQTAAIKTGKHFIWPENLTGPIALRALAKRYITTDDLQGEKLERHIIHNPTAQKTFGSNLGLGHALIMLPPHSIYPFSWDRDGEAFRNFCEANKPEFDPKRCKELVAADHWPSYTITYWSHTWNLGQDHNEDNLHAVGG